MKRILCLFLSVLFTCAVLTGCGCAPQTPPAENPPQEGERDTVFPLLRDDESENPLGQHGDTTVFGILTEKTDDGMTLQMQGESFFFAWTDTAKRHYDLLEIKVGDEVAIQFETKNDGTHIANDVELVTTSD